MGQHPFQFLQIVCKQGEKDRKEKEQRSRVGWAHDHNIGGHNVLKIFDLLLTSSSSWRELLSNWSSFSKGMAYMVSCGHRPSSD